MLEFVRRKHQITLFGELAFEEVMDLLSVRLRDKDARKEPTNKFHCYNETPDLYSRGVASNFHHVRPTFIFLEKFSCYGQIRE